ncbi:UNKNOWN [Stylonychia lemnae]|uniref:Apolipoprotein d n=1 Tax=Stylonychia lemnae TaxID=5949 RepID=A0A078AHS0_STYLE|nr:UNKNOWN [Stylonychia lemnae]|eukprot:CDW81421.1 UNKNOWN [Stylonychia lemnae]
MANRNFLLFTLIIALASYQSQAKFELGLCQAVESKIPDPILNVTNLMGIWFEYLVTPDLKENTTYSCASWLMMQENKNDSRFVTIYNRFDPNTNQSSLKTFEMNCEPTQYITNTAVCYYQQDTPNNIYESYTSHRARSLRIIYTDYFSYLIARVCQSYGLYHYIDYIVLTRDKTPSIYHRKQIKEKLTAYGLSGQDFDKGLSKKCWGEDFWS